jgi:thymidylate synthase
MATQFIGKTADQVWQKAAKYFTGGKRVNHQDSRTGKTLEVLRANINITQPRQRWVTTRKPTINPAFAIAECIWFIMGENNSAFLNYWNTQLPKYAGRVKCYHGAYGNRLVRHFGVDQISTAYKTLLRNPKSRQVVLQIWDPKADLPFEDGQPRDPDIPCNLLCLLKIREKRLEWTQVVRSNDLFLGVPYNIAQFTFLQEIMASWLGIEMGSFFLLCDSLHVYEKDIDKVTLSCQTPNLSTTNTDVISLKRNESFKYFSELYSRAVTLTKYYTSLSDILDICKWPKAPLFLQNFLRVLSAEACRKKKDLLSANNIMKECTNPALLILWHNWHLRWSPKEGII